MKITGIETFLLRCPLPKDWAFPTASFVAGGSLFLKVTTDAGIVGWGEPSPYGALPETTREVLRTGISELFLGKSPSAVEALTRQEESRGEHLYGKAAWTSALAGLSQALWDILGKAENKPVNQLLHLSTPPKQRVRAYASGGMIYEDSPREWLVEEALRAQAAGYTAWKFRPPSPRGGGSHFQRNQSPPAFDAADLLQVARKLREALGAEFELMLDFGCRIGSLPEAIRIGEELGELGFVFLEEPLPRKPELYHALVENLSVPIAIGECFFSAGEFARWMQADAVNVLQPDANFAGMNEILAISALAERAQKPLVLHNWASAVSIAANVQLAAALPTCSLLEFNLTYNPLRTELVREPLVPQNGFFSLPDRPGLGIEIDERALRRYL